MEIPLNETPLEELKRVYEQAREHHVAHCVRCTAGFAVAENEHRPPRQDELCAMFHLIRILTVDLFRRLKAQQ